MVCWHISWWKRRINRGQISECKKQGWSINIYSRVFKIFCISDEICKKFTETSNKIDGKLVSKTVLEDTGALENLTKFKSHVNYADFEVTKDHLYIKTRTFSLVKSRRMPTNYYFGNTKPGRLEQQSENDGILLAAPETWLEGYKISYWQVH